MHRLEKRKRLRLQKVGLLLSREIKRSEEKQMIFRDVFLNGRTEKFLSLQIG